MDGAIGGKRGEARSRRRGVDLGRLGLIRKIIMHHVKVRTAQDMLDLIEKHQSHKIHVRNLSMFRNEQAAELALLDHFSPFGPILDVKVLRNSQNSMYAFVTFLDEEAVIEALNGGNLLMKRELRIQRAKLSSRPQERDVYLPKCLKIFVGGLPTNCTREDFLNYFGVFGTIVDYCLPGSNPKNSGFGFVTFEETESARAVFDKKVHYILGKMIDVKVAWPRRDNSPNSRVFTTLQSAPEAKSAKS